MNEFDLIRKYFRRDYRREDIIVGNGDDCAVVSIPAGHQMATSIDTLVEGVHFLADTNPEWLGHKALAVSLSDLAAMGSVPRWATLALTLPEADDEWLAAFSKGFLSLADRFNVALIGGDTTRGPLSISVQVMGIVMEGQAVRRSGASEGDDIYVTGQLGDACLGLMSLENEALLEPHLAYSCRMRLERPDPRVSVGVGLSPFASAMIDCSDGLLADLGHLLAASGLGGVIKRERFPLSEAVRSFVTEHDNWQPVFAGGDDYELVFTAPPSSRSIVAAMVESTGCSISWLGTVTTHDELIVLGDDDLPMSLSGSGYRHF